MYDLIENKYEKLYYLKIEFQAWCYNTIRVSEIVKIICDLGWLHLVVKNELTCICNQINSASIQNMVIIGLDLTMQFSFELQWTPLCVMELPIVSQMH